MIVYHFIFFMSVYDPFKLYTHHQKKSHDGQVIRKKLIPPPNIAISEEMLKQAQDILIKAGIRGFNSSINKRLFVFRQYPNLQTENLSITPGESGIAINFSSFWDAIKGDFASIYNTVNPLSVQNIIFHIHLNSFILGPLFNVVTTGNLTFSFTFDGVSLNYTRVISNGRGCIACISFTTKQFFLEINTPISDVDNSLLSNKGTETSHPYLTSVTNNSPAILTTLKNSDYTVFNPVFFTLQFANSTNQTMTISNVIYNLTVELAVEYR